jgi:hypothetical protein
MAGSTRIPPLSMLLGYGPMAFFPALAAAAWLAPSVWSLRALVAAQFWGAALLLFLAGVRRGLSFFTEGGPRWVQIATMMWLFLLGLAAALAPLPLAISILIVGFGSIAVLDPPAARRGEAPAFFARLRPPQMSVALVGLALLSARIYY